MKRYVKPSIEYIKIRPEERLAVCDSEGACSEEWPDYDKNGNPDIITIS